MRQLAYKDKGGLRVLFPQEVRQLRLFALVDPDGIAQEVARTKKAILKKRSACWRKLYDAGFRVEEIFIVSALITSRVRMSRKGAKR